MTIDGQEYKVIGEKPVPGFPDRVEIEVQKPRGKRTYHVVRYEDGTFSGAV